MSCSGEGVNVSSKILSRNHRKSVYPQTFIVFLLPLLLLIIIMIIILTSVIIIILAINLKGSNFMKCGPKKLELELGLK